MNRIKYLALVLVFGAGPALAAHPGYVDLEGIEAFSDASPSVDVTLGDWMLNFGGQAMEDDPDLAALRGLESLRVRIYQGADEKLGHGLADFGRELASSGWQSVVSVTDKRERVRVLMMPEGNNIAGLTVLVHSGSEAILVNAYGEIRPQDLGRMISGISDIGGADLARLNADIDFQ